MKHVSGLIVIGSALSLLGSSAAFGQATPSMTGGNSTQISNSNRDQNAAYNRLVGATSAKSSNSDVKIQSKHPVPATAADIKPGAVLRGTDGVPIGTIVSVDAAQAVVDTGHSKIAVPLQGFGKDEQGLLLNMTSTRFAELAAAAHAKSQAPGSH